MRADIPIQRIIWVLRRRWDENELTGVFMAMANTPESMDALHDLGLLLGCIDLDGLGRLQVRIFSLLGGNAFRVHGLRHGLYDVKLQI
jgi:hypothetical protein